MIPLLKPERLIPKADVRPDRVASGNGRPEYILLGACLVLLVVAVASPPVAQPVQYHDFADQRAWLGLPHAMDVLSNLPFAALGLLGGWYLWKLPAVAVSPAQQRLAGLFLAGLLLTAACSSWYHLQPEGAGLAIDRYGMVVAFGGLIGLAAATRIGERAGQWLAVAVLLLGLASVRVCSVSGNVLPWVVLQAGGMALILWMAALKPLDGALPVRWAGVVLIYALAKVFEHMDVPVYQLTDQLVSGHSLKHIVASLAALPVLVALRHAGRCPKF